MNFRPLDMHWPTPEIASGQASLPDFGDVCGDEKTARNHEHTLCENSFCGVRRVVRFRIPEYGYNAKQHSEHKYRALNQP